MTVKPINAPEEQDPSRLKTSGHDHEQPLSETLLGDDDAGGLAGQGGIVDIGEDEDDTDLED